MDFMNTVEELELKTSAFWKLSSIWNGRIPTEIATGEAIEMCAQLNNMTNYARPLSHCVDGLLQEIIKGEGTKAITTKILEFAPPIKKKARST